MHFLAVHLGMVTGPGVVPDSGGTSFQADLSLSQTVKCLVLSEG
jgi:hypothetical protein